MSIGAQYPSPEAGLLQLTAQGSIHVPLQGGRVIVSTNLGHHERRQVFTGERLLDPTLQAAARDALLVSLA